MASVIYFAGGKQVMVEENADEVFGALQVKPGVYVRLTQSKSGEPIFLQPAQVTHWHELKESEARKRLASGGGGRPASSMR